MLQPPGRSPVTAPSKADRADDGAEPSSGAADGGARSAADGGSRPSDRPAPSAPSAPSAQAPSPQAPSAQARADAARLLRLLTRREAQVLARLAAGDDNRAIGAALGISPATVKTHLQRAMRKLGVGTRADATRLAALIGTVRTEGAPADLAAPASPATPAAPGAPAPPAPPATAGTPGSPGSPGGTSPAEETPATEESSAADAGNAAHQEPAPAAPSPPVAPSPPAASPAAPSGAAVPAVEFAAFSAAAHTRLVQQTYLVTGSVRRAGRSVHRALGSAAMRWEEVSALPDPEAWVRAAAFESALSPWHRGGGGRRRATRAERVGRDGPAGSAAADRALLAALLRLSRVRRRAVVLHDAVGLPVPELALEVEASTAAAEGRVLAGREELARAVPALVGDDPLAPGFGAGLGTLLHDAAVRGCPAPPEPSAAGLASAARLRAGAATAAAALLTVTVGGAMVATFVGADPGSQARPRPGWWWPRRRRSAPRPARAAPGRPPPAGHRVCTARGATPSLPRRRLCHPRRPRPRTVRRGQRPRPTGATLPPRRGCPHRRRPCRGLPRHPGTPCPRTPSRSPRRRRTRRTGPRSAQGPSRAPVAGPCRWSSRAPRCGRAPRCRRRRCRTRSGDRDRQGAAENTTRAPRTKRPWRPRAR
ncbi:hypothetical protein GCM10025734_36670 [Kitasatospora paranensis]|uniref:LuxR C-terminal-related transcriptional regulator n=1 Tax=Kitasatospora paranensis TaxID=258053 RepID=UPI0031EAFE72